MRTYARIIDDVAVDVCTDPAAQFHPQLAAQFEAVPADVVVGSRRIDGQWQPPPPAAPLPDMLPLAELRTAADQALTAACAAAITAGVGCAALGTLHDYPTAPTDQANLTGAVTYSLLPDTPADWSQPLTCRDTAGVWARRPHDRTQLYAVATAVVQHIDGCRARLAALRAQLAAATDSAALAAVTWEG